MVIVRRGHPLLGAAIVGGVAYKVGQAKAQQAQQQAQQQQAAPVQAAPVDKFAMIEKLNQLKKSGALTEEEFQREKEKLLNS